jgi:transcriptional regulator with PAS, ATPase and Fis domain
VLAKVSPASSTVLLVGESGTGKELVARAIHRNSPRRERPLVAVSCAAIPETLLESELFGYERGAFTGATARRTGLIEEADRSTLFLDEIGELDPTMQAKILRFLQERKVRRVGGREDIRVDARVIAATNRDLDAEIRRGKFREDLYYRLNWIRITLPPLRERSTDIPELVEHFIAKSNAAAGKAVRGIATEALRVLMGFPWPGNVRQLESVIDRAVLLTEGEVIGVDDLPIEVRAWYPTPAIALAQAPDPFALPDTGISIEDWERRLILQAMERSGWVIAKAAKLLGMSYKTLQYRLEKFKIRRPGDASNEVDAT